MGGLSSHDSNGSLDSRIFHALWKVKQVKLRNLKKNNVSYDICPKLNKFETEIEIMHDVRMINRTKSGPLDFHFMFFVCKKKQPTIILS